MPSYLGVVICYWVFVFWNMEYLFGILTLTMLCLDHSKNALHPLLITDTKMM